MAEIKRKGGISSHFLWHFLGVVWDVFRFLGILAGIDLEYNPPKRGVFFIQWQVLGIVFVGRQRGAEARKRAESVDAQTEASHA
jgi:hypothetical protein